MKILGLLSMLVTAAPVSGLHMCEPFLQAKHRDLTLTIVEAEKTPSGEVSFTFFVEKDGVECTDEYALASISHIYKEVQKLPLKAYAPPGSKLVDCAVSTPGWEEYRSTARVSCQVDVEDPDQVNLYLEDTAMEIKLCSDPTPPKRSYNSLAVSVRSFSSTVFGTDKVAVTPTHVTRWLDYHIKLGLERFYLYERNRGELEEYLGPFFKEKPWARDMVEITYVPRLSAQNKTYDTLATPSYIFDQILGMDASFARARTENYDFVFHIDFDEFIHVTRHGSLHEAFNHDISYCPIPNALAVVRCNIPGVKYDVTAVTPEAICGLQEGNAKSAFNVTYFQIEQEAIHNVHVVNPRCNSESLLIHHLTDMYADRWNNPMYQESLEKL